MATKTVTALLGPKQAAWLEKIRKEAKVETDEQAVRVAIGVAHRFLTEVAPTIQAMGQPLLGGRRH